MLKKLLLPAVLAVCAGQPAIAQQAPAISEAVSESAETAGDATPAQAQTTPDEKARIAAMLPEELPELPVITVEKAFFTLDNGMQALVIVNRKIPAVVHALWYRTGAADEPPGESGIAHLFEHLMFKGSETYPKGYLSRTVAAAGGDDNAFTMQDATGYYQYVPADMLEKMMMFEADRMKNLRFTEADLKIERDVVLQERLMRVENSPSARLGEQMRAALFLHHPYGTPVIGWEHEIKDLDMDALNAFYQEHYAPDNALLVVAGDIDVERVKMLAEKHYGVLKPSGKKTRFMPQEPDIRRGETQIVLRDPLAGADKWTRIYAAPGYAGEKNVTGEELSRIHALSVLEYMLAGSEDAPLYKHFVTDTKIAAGLGASYSPLSRGPSDFSVYATLTEGNMPADFEAALEAYLAEKKAETVTEAWTEEVKRRMVADRLFSLESMRSLAFSYGLNALVAGDTAYLDKWSERIKKVTVDDVSAAYDAMFTEQRPAVTGILTAREE